MNEWILPCNLKYYDVDGAFSKLKRLDWKQTLKRVEVGDIVYIYIGIPVQAIKYKCRVNKVNLLTIEIDDSDYVLDGSVYLGYPTHMELELLKVYDPEYLTLSKLHECGLKGNIQSQRSVPNCIKSLIKLAE